MSQPSYPYSTAHIFALENKLISRERIERMVEAPTAADALKILSETRYGTAVSELEGPHDYEKILSMDTKNLYDFFQTISPEPDITNLFFLKYDFHNLKVLLKSKYLEENPGEFLIEDSGTISLEALRSAVNNEGYTMVPAYIKEVLQELNEVMENGVDPQKIDIMLDHAMYRHIFMVAGKRKSNFALKYFSLQIDLINIRSFLRVRKIKRGFEFLRTILIPGGDLEEGFFSKSMDESIENLPQIFKDRDYGQMISDGIEDFIKTNSLSRYERLMDDYLLSFVRKARWNPLGIEPIIGYLLARENEIRLIRIIMVGKNNNLPLHVIRERLRDVYV